MENNALSLHAPIRTFVVKVLSYDPEVSTIFGRSKESDCFFQDLLAIGCDFYELLNLFINCDAVTKHSIAGIVDNIPSIERIVNSSEKELLSSDYDELWNEIIGSSGEIIISSSTHVPNFIFSWPLDGDYRISSGFGTRTDPINGVVKTHGGTDIAAATGTPILAAADGTVEIAGYNAGGYGYYVKISHGEGYETLYGHCSVLLVSTGQTVKQGQVIAKVGSTGHPTGPHLHFEVRYNGNKVNPMFF